MNAAHSTSNSRTITIVTATGGSATLQPRSQLQQILGHAPVGQLPGAPPTKKNVRTATPRTTDGSTYTTKGGTALNQVFAELEDA
eukprot:CAMPEP_0197675940 /NCGR_PEP_ID=MMETSP1338-20131121/85862_1 /TAXON_ID=43686 ORGANISM="Pelagodinium beii, Strain RCC1491" /NCGR_SAMPLE_ID=MMETSP1338 /ASSEMBLY_ACC=CAM_ASM_000754 /LENGTH=84 /DNA_ID=CAMNT_0043256547 /DNA_START=38 /DNA_END=288 /DNA_ORIENTATION=-